MATIPQISTAKRVVLKIGSALLVDQDSGLRSAWLETLCSDIAKLKSRGTDVLVVSSGAIALGRGLLGLRRGVLKLEESQAAAAIGQIALSRAWSEALAAQNLQGGQVLVTLEDTQRRRRYLNAMSTIETLLSHSAVPIINENDTVATSEIRYGDNDRLAARVASMMSADVLVLLSDVDGLYTAPPAENSSAEHLPVIDNITPDIYAMAGAAGSELSRGGMKTKIEAAEISTNAGCAMVIAQGKELSPVSAIENGAKCSWFTANDTPLSARKKWIAGQVVSKAKLHLDEGACQALRQGKSLLPAGVKNIEGEFERGDPVAIADSHGSTIGYGLIAYDAVDAKKLAGHQSDEVEKILGFAGRAEMIHRDNLALIQDGDV